MIEKDLKVSSGGGTQIGGVTQMPVSLGANPVINGASFISAGVYETDLNKVHDDLKPSIIPVFTRELLPWNDIGIGKGKIVKVNGSTAVCVSQKNTAIYVTHDEGVSWSRKEAPKTALGAKCDHLDYNPKTQTWIALCADAFQDYCLRSTDNGETWTSVLVSSHLNANSGASIINVSENVWLVNSHGFSTNYRSTDDGATWSTAGSMNGANLAVNNDGSVIIAAINGGSETKASYDKGLTWKSVGAHNTSSIVGLSYITGAIWMTYGNGNRLQVSRDDGATWANAGLRPTEMNNRNLQSAFYSSVRDELLVSSNQHGGTIISKDLGRTWSFILDSGYASIAFGNSKYFVSGGSVSNTFLDGVAASGVGTSKLGVGIPIGTLGAVSGITENYLRTK